MSIAELDWKVLTDIMDSSPSNLLADIYTAAYYCKMVQLSLWMQCFKTFLTAYRVWFSVREFNNCQGLVFRTAWVIKLSEYFGRSPVRQETAITTLSLLLFLLCRGLVWTNKSTALFQDSGNVYSFWPEVCYFSYIYIFKYVQISICLLVTISAAQQTFKCWWDKLLWSKVNPFAKIHQVNGGRTSHSLLFCVGPSID